MYLFYESSRGLSLHGSVDLWKEDKPGRKTHDPGYAHGVTGSRGGESMPKTSSREHFTPFNKKKRKKRKETVKLYYLEMQRL